MPKQIESYKDTIARPILSRRFSGLREKGRADLVRKINVFYPYEIVGKIVGYDFAHVEFVATCMDGIWQGNHDIETDRLEPVRLQLTTGSLGYLRYALS